MQLLEGEKKVIDELYQNIENDKRHFNVQLMETAESDDKIFFKLGDGLFRFEGANFQ